MSEEKQLPAKLFPYEWNVINKALENMDWPRSEEHYVRRKIEKQTGLNFGEWVKK